jgi:hypothetical protein
MQVVRMARGILLLLTFMALDLSPGVSFADDKLAEMVRACAALRTDAERLACFDRRVVPAASGVTADESPSPEDMFGMSGSVASPEVEQPKAKPADPERIDRISARVTDIDTLARGEKVLTLDNGQVWETVDSGELLLSPGDPVTITRAAMGTFRLVTSSHRTARIKRLH